MDKREFEAFTLKDKIISEISKSILDKYSDYDFFDITLTDEFYVIEALVSSLVDKTASRQLIKGHYKSECEHCKHD